MAVYTKVPFDACERFLTNYSLGSLQKMQEILQGVENSNYFITTDVGRYVLTLFEKRVKKEDLPFFMELMRHLAEKGLPCPLPIADNHGDVLHQLCGRSATIISFLDGKMTDVITPSHCRQVGEALALMHEATTDFKLTRHNDLSLTGWERLTNACAAGADSVAQGLGALIANEISFLQKNWPAPTALPRGVIHADLFNDNVFFKDGHLCGLIDFYFSCTDFLVYDLAIGINAWCFDEQHAFVEARAAEMVAGYEKARPLSQHEKNALPLLLRGAALRFLLTRLFDLLNHPEGALVKPKDPLEYRDKLVFFQSNRFHALLYAA